ncbi:MAG: tripartite tricarboxylate transporter substrate binding protein [Xanthobacteraceae bacterium]|nr:tripartite tricarboxylate transporter substrate binding protein [Xanthobacteraceae bacterium]
MPTSAFTHSLQSLVLGRRSIMAAGVVALLALCACPVAAQEYPAKTIRVVVPFPAGGGTDVITRILIQKLGDALKKPVIVDNIAGASGAIGHEAVARASADGYTLLMATGSTIAANPVVSKVPWDPVKDFTPIAMLVVDPLPLVLNPSVPAKNVQELIALAKQKPGGLTMASFGTGSVPHLAGELFNIQAGTKMLHVPYKGGAQAMSDLIAGHVSLMFNTMGAVSGPLAAGKIRAIAVGAPQRNSAIPDVPTVKESGLPDFEATSWVGLFGPAKLPQPIVTRLSKELAAVLKLPEVKERMAKMGSDIASGTPEELADFLDRDLKRWGKLVREGNIRAD